MARRGEEANNPQSHIRAVLRVCDILDALQEADGGLSLDDLVSRVDLPKTSAHRYMTTLEERRYLERDESTGLMYIGKAFLPMRAKREEHIARRVRPILEGLRDRTGETVNFGILEGRHIRYVDIVESAKAIRWSGDRGSYGYIHSTALGKAIAAGLEPQVLEAIFLEESLPRVTDHTVANVQELEAALAQVRRQGYAVDDQENESDARCVGVALPKELGIEAAVSVSAPATRMTLDDTPQIALWIREALTELLEAEPVRSQHANKKGKT